MANQEHLEILKQGIETWNQWRLEHSGINPDLSKADLANTNLSSGDFGWANLSGVDLPTNCATRL